MDEIWKILYYAFMTKENEPRLEFLRLKRMVGIAATVGVLAGCAAVPEKEHTKASVSELATLSCEDNESVYDVAGKVRKVGENSYYVPRTYINYSGNVSLSLSKVVRTAYQLREPGGDKADPFITVNDKKGGMYLPMPIVGAEGSDYDGLVNVIGTYEAVKDKNRQEQCVLVASSIVAAN